MRDSLTTALAGQAIEHEGGLMSTPKPASESSRDATDRQADGDPAVGEKKVTFTIDRELAARFKRWAKAEGRLHSKLVEVCISDYLRQTRSKVNGNSNGNGYNPRAQPAERSARREDKRQNENFDTVTVSINEALLIDFRIEALHAHKRLYELAEDCLRTYIPPEF
jgi:hypothetical protein